MDPLLALTSTLSGGVLLGCQIGAPMAPLVSFGIPAMQLDFGSLGLAFAGLSALAALVLLGLLVLTGFRSSRKRDERTPRPARTWLHVRALWDPSATDVAGATRR